MASSGNFSTFNPLDNTENNGVGGCDFAIGNCQGGGAGDNVGIASTIATGNTGKYYAEFYLSATPGTAYVGYYPSTESAIMTKVWVPSGNRTWLTSNLASYAQNGYLYKDGSSTSSWGSTFTTGDIIQIAIDADNDAVYYGKNNTWQNSGDPESGSSKTGAARTSIPKNVFPAVGHANGSGTVTWKANFGQDSTFGGTISAGGNADANGFGDFKYAPPTGYVALSTANLPISDDIDPAQTDDDFPQKQFNTVLYTGNGSDGHAITGVGFQPDLVFFQRRSISGSFGNGMIDSSRGATKGLYPNISNAEADFTNDFASFDSDGFTLQAGSSANINNPSKTFVAWCWRANGGTTASNSEGSTTCTVQANTKGGFSIITYTGTGSAATLGHGLEKAPEFIMAKRRSSPAQTWKNYHVGLGATKYLTLNASDAAATSSGMWNDTEPSTTLISIGNESNVSTSGLDYIIYAWHSVEGFSKFGSYEGNGSADGAFIYTGFRPSLIFLKRTDSTGSWLVHDNKRDTENPVNKILLWDTTDAEFESGDRVDFLSNGFKLRNSNAGMNGSGNDYVYGAWGNVPFKYNNTF